MSESGLHENLGGGKEPHENANKALPCLWGRARRPEGGAGGGGPTADSHTISCDRGWISKAIYRISQGLRTLLAFAWPLDASEAERLLAPPLLALFRRMRRADQWHSLSVMRTLVAQGHTDPDLLAAALLHDVGKVRYPITLFGRTLAVLTRALAPKRYTQWGQGKPRGWRRPFVVAHQHSAWSAKMLAGAGASPMVVALARRHQTPLEGPPQCEEDRLLMLLRKADDAS